MALGSGDILRIVASLLFTDGNVVQNVFNAVLSGGVPPYDDDDILVDAENWLVAMFGNLTATATNTLDGNEVIVYVYDAVGDDFDEVGTNSWTWNPAGAGDALPRGVAALVNVRTTNPDISGKKYLAGIPEGNLTGALWTAGTIVLLTDFADDWITEFVGAQSGATFTPGVWSPTHLLLQPMSGTYTVPTEPSYQRRRKRGVGA